VTSWPSDTTMGPPLHLFPDCPEGKLIGIARRDAVTDQTALDGLELCDLCQEESRYQSRSRVVAMSQIGPSLSHSGP
jgi:hypothetical protein